MYEETRQAIKRAFSIGKIIFGLGIHNYSKLLKAVESVSYPTKEELKKYIDNGMCYEEAVLVELKKKYEATAVQSGFTRRHGLAMLEYASMVKEMNQ